MPSIPGDPADFNDCASSPDANPIGYTNEYEPFEPGLLDRLPVPPRRVVFLRASRIGDLINCSPAFQAMRTALPGAEICLITLPMLVDVAERFQSVDRVFTFPGYPMIAEQLFDPRHAVDFFAQMQAENYDLAVQIQGTGVYSNPFTLLLGAKHTAGFVRPGDGPGLLASALPWPDGGHEVERCLALIRHIGAPIPPGLMPEFGLRGEDHAGAERWLAKASPPYIGIHTSARDWTRRWPIERFAQAAAALQRRTGGTVIFIGEARDREAGTAALDDAGAAYLNLAGCTSLPVTGAVIQRMSVFLTNDTGPAHIAYAVGAPVVTIFGGGDPARNGPLTPGPHRILAHPVPCRPCDTGDCPYALRCLEGVTVEQVVQAALEIMRQ